MAKPRRKAQPDLQLVTAPDRPTFKAPPPLRPLTEAQRLYLSSLRANTCTISVGPAGVGKTYIALATAAEMLQQGQVDKILLVRPIVGADDDIGVLPGTVMERLAPWVLPMLDILEDRMGKTYVEYLLKVDRIRISPLATMRGSSFKNSFIMATEMQNSTVKQMKMLLTRVGEDTKVAVDADPMQTDLAGLNGLEDAMQRLDGMNRVGVVRFTRDDVVRSGFCRDVLDRYEP